MTGNTLCLKASLLKVTVFVITVHVGNLLNAQHYEWQIDKEKRIEQEKKLELDSLLVHLKNNWQLSLGYGQFYLENSAKSKENAILEFPKNMNAWNLSFARYLSEHLSVNANCGLLIKKIEPPRPDIFSVINGANIDIEGGGFIFIPISVGMDYFFLKQRLRPYAGLGVGAVLAREKYVEASGSLSNGINRDEYEFSSRSTFIELSSGFIYRTGEKVQLGLNCDYLRSKNFGESVGGYQAYNGIKIAALLAIVF